MRIYQIIDRTPHYPFINFVLPLKSHPHAQLVSGNSDKNLNMAAGVATNFRARSITGEAGTDLSQEPLNLSLRMESHFPIGGGRGDLNLKGLSGMGENFSNLLRDGRPICTSFCGWFIYLFIYFGCRLLVLLLSLLSLVDTLSLSFWLREALLSSSRMPIGVDNYIFLSIFYLFICFSLVCLFYQFYLNYPCLDVFFFFLLAFLPVSHYLFFS